jgi:hypothetical protein
MSSPLQTCDLTAARQREAATEALVFLELERERDVLRNRTVGKVILQSPNTRSLWQRFRDWTAARPNSFTASAGPRYVSPTKEPNWPQHWATRKYL